MHKITITTDDIRDAWSKIQRGQNPIPGQKSLDSYQGRWRGDTMDTFTGCSGTEMNRRLTEGYVPEATPEVDADTGTDFNLPSIELDEDGSLILDAALAGEDFYRVQWIDRPTKRGLTIRANTAFAAGTDAARQISRYLDWLLAVVDAAQTQGIPVDLDLVIKAKGSWTTRRQETLEVIIPVFRAGETMDVAAWRAFLSPGSFRSLGFLAMGIASDRLGKTLNSGLGYPTGSDWTVDFDNEAGILTLDVPPMPSGTFPAEQMTERVQEAFAAM